MSGHWGTAKSLIKNQRDSQQQADEPQASSREDPQGKQSVYTLGELSSDASSIDEDHPEAQNHLAPPVVHQGPPSSGSEDDGVKRITMVGHKQRLAVAHKANMANNHKNKWGGIIKSQWKERNGGSAHNTKMLDRMSTATARSKKSTRSTRDKMRAAAVKKISGADKCDDGGGSKSSSVSSELSLSDESEADRTLWTDVRDCLRRQTEALTGLANDLHLQTVADEPVS